LMWSVTAITIPGSICSRGDGADHARNGQGG